MKIHELEPQKRRGEDCINLAVSNVLRSKGLENYNYVWKQCGLRYLKNGHSIGTLSSNFLSLEEELSWVNNVKVISNNQYHDDNYLREIRKLVNRGEPVVIFVDSFYIKGTPNYKKYHVLHCIYLVNVNNKGFTFIDDAFMNKDFITNEELLAATDINFGPNPQKFKKRYLILSVDNINIDIGLSDLMDVISTNARMLKGEENDGYVSGLEAIDFFIIDTQLCLQKGEELNYNFLFGIHTNLQLVSNSRFLFSQFLQYHGSCLGLGKEFSSIIEDINEISQDWNVCANMIIKGLYKRKEEMLKRVLKKLLIIQEKESSLVKKCLNFEVFSE